MAIGARLASVIAIVFIAAISCAGAQPLRIGLPLPLTGVFRVNGAAMRTAARLYADQALTG
jgi:hypothetical protein